MKKYLKAVLNTFFFFLFFNSNAQTGIGIKDVHPSTLLQLESKTQAFVMPRLTDAQMLLVPSPLIGAQVYNTTYNSIFFYTAIGWRNINSSALAAVMVDKNFGSGTIPAVNDTYYVLPIGTSDVKYNTAGVFSVEANGTIRVKTTGTYLISAGVSVSNMPAGSRKYALKVYNNTNPISVLSAGEATLAGVDYWGVNGVCVATLTANDLITVKYLINNNGGNLSPKFVNISITQL